MGALALVASNIEGVAGAEVAAGVLAGQNGSERVGKFGNKGILWWSGQWRCVIT